jgi:hypothetical protein
MAVAALCAPAEHEPEIRIAKTTGRVDAGFIVIL